MADFHDPYLYPGTKLLRNLQNEYDPERAAAAERAFSLLRHRELEIRPVNPSVDTAFDLRHLREIHRRLFQDVWAWAGQIRDVDIRKGDSQFAGADDIEPEFAALHKWLTNDTQLLSDPDIDDETFVSQAAELLEKVNRVHPFREGNGRTQRAYLDQVASMSDRTLSWQNIDPRQNIIASVKAQELASGEPFKSLLVAALQPPVDGLELLGEEPYVVTAPTTQGDNMKLTPEQLSIRMRRFPELLEEQQLVNSATDPDYLTFE